MVRRENLRRVSVGSSDLVKHTLALCLLLISSPALAGQLDATWTAPTTYTDGSPLTESLTYRVYWQLFPQTPCPGTQFIVTNPDTTAATLINLTQGMTYNAQVTAVGSSGESACSTVASAPAPAGPSLRAGSSLRIAFSVTSPPPSGFTVSGLTANQTVNGLLRVSASVNPGTTATGATFTLKNAAGTIISSNAEGAVPYCFIGDMGALPC